ncbi:hypothetical protein Patl1_28547 [Pistacia atlantica]|uniref:Uncharacterized protein n=1 Tax=Pistacia atlantica TaxID=434234 RepID=A0ACC1BDU8_9ROSI|nr:hypothetical protein Patl1_28547 [Pistacia atlantica]
MTEYGGGAAKAGSAYRLGRRKHGNRNMSSTTGGTQIYLRLRRLELGRGLINC